MISSLLEQFLFSLNHDTDGLPDHLLTAITTPVIVVHSMFNLPCALLVAGLSNVKIRSN